VYFLIENKISAYSESLGQVVAGKANFCSSYWIILGYWAVQLIG